jgi:hypothetical protein
VDVQHLDSALLIGDVDLNVHFQSPRSQHCLVNEVLPVGDADDEDVVEGVDAVDAGQQLVDDEVVHAVAGLRAPLLADRVDLVEDYAVQLALGALLLLLLPGVLEELSDLLLALAHELVEDLRAVDYLRLHFQDLADLPCDERLACAWRSVQQHSLDVLESQRPHEFRVDHPRGKDPPIDELELLVESAHLEALHLRLVVFKEFVHVLTVIDDFYPLVGFLPKVEDGLILNLAEWSLIHQFGPELHLNVLELEGEVDIVIDETAMNLHFLF